MRVHDGGPPAEAAYPSTKGSSWGKDDRPREFVDRGQSTVKDFFDLAWRRLQDVLRADR